MTVIASALADVSPIAFRRYEDFSPVTVGRRKRVAKDTLFFAEFQVKYGMYQNYLHYWIDRPLFWDRSLRPQKFAYETPESFAVHVREAKFAGLDGFNCFTSKALLPHILNFRRWLSDSGEKDFSILPTLGYGEDGRRTVAPDTFLKTIAMEIDDVSFPRVGGRPIVPTYGYLTVKPEEHRQMIADMEAKLGKGSFALCGDIDSAVLEPLKKTYREKGMLSDDDKETLNKAICAVLDVAGGVQIRADELRRPFDGQYCCTYDMSFFDNCTLPALENLLARPEYANKVVGFYVQQGYVNHLSGDDNGEDCTESLRRFLRSVIRANPDYLLFFEWNEVNENTMFQPTVWGGRVAPRILRWHSRMLKGLGADPFPDDDVSVPPLTLSYRATLKPGEEFRLELLNIPDGVFSKCMTAKVVLRDVNGRAVADFPEERIDPAKFGAVTYIVDSIALHGGTVLEPSLVVDGLEYGGFSPIRIDPTYATNYKAVRQCLRDGMRPVVREASVTKVGCGEYAHSFSADFGEPLASVELVCDEDEVSAAGIDGEYDFVSNYVFYVTMNIPVGKNDFGWFSVSVPGVKGCSLLPKYTANINPGVPVRNPDGEGFRVQALCWSAETGYYLLVPKSVPRDAVVEAKWERPGFGKLSVTLDALLKRGVAGAILDDSKTSLRVDVRRVKNLPDLPAHLGKNDVCWRGATETDVRHPVFHFRVISESGRIWRSRPFIPDALPERASSVRLPVYDEFSRRPSFATTPAALVPKISYVFDPAVGAAMSNTWDPNYDAQLGGGFRYCEAFSDGRIKVSDGGRAPKWVKDGGAWCLEFDGENDYINFPREAVPCAPFAIGMEVKPDCTTNAPVVLFRHFAFIRGSISLFIVNGELVATWADRDLSREPRICTGLKVENGAWHRIVFSYDLKTFVFKVDENEYKYDWEGRPFRFKPSVFGGHTKYELVPAGGQHPVYYKGLLRSIVIRHMP